MANKLYIIVFESDTENDDTLMPACSRRPAAAAAASVVQLDDIDDDSSDFEVSSKSRAKYCAVTVTIFQIIMWWWHYGDLILSGELRLGFR